LTDTSASPPTSSGTDTLTREAPETVEPGDHDKFAHYVEKDKLLEAQVLGVSVQALCGKMWLPTEFDPLRPICPDCKRVYDEVLETGDNVGGSGDRSGGEG
jgi:hypothetical protein